jgi:hypothetical protein
VDDFSRYMWVSLLSSKDQAALAIKRVQAATERKSGNVLCALRTDRGGEFIATQFHEYCAEIGRRELTTPYTPQQNGVIERRNQSVLVAARCMMKAKKMPGLFLGEVVNCVVYLLNRTTSKGTGGKTPYELWTGAKPSVNHLRTFGCIAHVKVTRPNLKKLEDRSKVMVFVGYEPGSIAYKCYDPITKKVHVSRDVVFDEEGTWDWLAEPSTDIILEFIVESEPEFFHTTRTKVCEQTPIADGSQQC